MSEVKIVQPGVESIGLVSPGTRRGGLYAAWGKRAFDVTAALALIVAISPILLLIAIAVRMDGGPATFGHVRIGRGGVPFKCLKFRSMVVDSAERLQELLERDPAARLEWATARKLKNDPRVTRFGGLLRRTSLDELPQVFNVLAGSMSFVGPRPVVKEELVRHYGDAAEIYAMVRPGITGLWQVSGRSDASYSHRVRADVRYVRSLSVRNDVKILFNTVGVVLLRRGAY